MSLKFSPRISAIGPLNYFLDENTVRFRHRFVTLDFQCGHKYVASPTLNDKFKISQLLFLCLLLRHFPLVFNATPAMYLEA
jgi:hypothetical protein